MLKRLSLLLAAAAVLAFAVPAFASATTGLTENGVLVAVGKKVEATSIGNVITTSTKTGNITCKKVTLTGEVTANSTATVQIKTVPDGIEHNTASECSVPSGATVTVPKISITEIHTTGEVISGSLKKGKFVVTFVVNIGTLTCTYTTAAGEGDYIAGTDEITVSEAPLSVTPAACGTTAKLDGKFTIETDASPATALILD